ncbi:MAG: GTPase Era [Desulfobacteraceae bacterium 4484_190.2]|nr:MAG: GTPase Era [Desulfobacteraceae bacterium 4484_190.2]
MTFLSGFIGIIGPPNVGKSTLLNRILKTKLAIVSPKPQTTRNRILGIYHGEGLQIIFMDTPGIHNTRSALHESMVASARAACREVDMVLLMIEICHPNDPRISSIVGNLKKMRKPCILAINKIDMMAKEHLLPVIDHYRQVYDFEDIIPVSAIKGDGLDRLLDRLKKSLRPGPQFFPLDMKTDQSEVALVSEIIREKIYSHTSKELPYSSAVSVDKMEEIPGQNLLDIAARIHVERESQKAVLIGKGGRMIKAIGRSARLELEKMFGVRIYLDLVVRVEKNWTRDTRALRRLGY